MHLVAVFGQVPLDPSDVPKELADRLVAGLIALQFNYQPERLRLVLCQKIDAANSSRILISGLIVTGFLVERPLPAKFQMVPVIPQETRADVAQGRTVARFRLKYPNRQARTPRPRGFVRFLIQKPPEGIQRPEVDLERISKLKQDLVDLDISIAEGLATVETRPNAQVASCWLRNGCSRRRIDLVV